MLRLFLRRFTYGIDFYPLIKKQVMDNNQKREPQEAPLKNTDNAFVQVGADGSPAMPQTNQQDQQEDALAEQQRKEAMTERD